MTRVEQRWRDALLAAMIPPAPPLPGLRALDLADFWRAFEEAAAPLLRFGLRAAVLLLTVVAPLFFLGRPRLFPSLSADDQERLLARAAVSRAYLVRQLVVTVKAAACFAYLRDARVRIALDASP